MKHLPNALTISRILVTPVMLILLFSGTTLGLGWAFVLFVAAAVSDYLDGKLARQYAIRSRLGTFLDPFADKVLVLGTFAVLAYKYPYNIPWWAVILIALRDVLVTALRTKAESQGQTVKTLGIARTKTLVQLIFLSVFLLVLFLAKLPGGVGESGRWILNSMIPLIVLIGVVAITLYTGFVYLFRRKYVSPAQLNG